MCIWGVNIPTYSHVDQWDFLCLFVGPKSWDLVAKGRLLASPYCHLG